MSFSANQILTAAQLNDLEVDSLDVDGSLTLSGESTSTISNSASSGREILQLRARTANSDGAGINLYGDADSSQAGNILFFAGNSSRMTIDSNGSVGIGASPANSRQLKIEETGGSGFSPLQCHHNVAVSGNNATAALFIIGNDGTNPDTSDYWLIFRKGDNTTIGSVRGTGSASVNFSTTSDETLKTDRGIASASRIGTIIDGLQVHEFDWNEGSVTDQIGLFAQEAIDVLPESIVNAPSTMPAEDEDAEDEYVPAALDYSKIVPILIAECQFLRQRVAALEAP